MLLPQQSIPYTYLLPPKVSHPLYYYYYYDEEEEEGVCGKNTT